MTKNLTIHNESMDSLNAILNVVENAFILQAHPPFVRHLP